MKHTTGCPVCGHRYEVDVPLATGGPFTPPVLAEHDAPEVVVQEPKKITRAKRTPAKKETRG